LFLLLVNNKTLLNYLAYIKVEVMKISDVQQQILDQLSNIDAQRQYSNISTMLSEEIDYFVSTWPISTQCQLDDLENRLQNEDGFKNKVVIFMNNFFYCIFKILINPIDVLICKL